MSRPLAFAPRSRRPAPVVAVIGALVALLPLAMPAAASASIVVDSLEDAATTDRNCTLREAITAANTDTGVDACAAGSEADTITFALDGSISLASALPSVAGTLTIDGSGATIEIRDGLAAPGGHGGALDVPSGAVLTVRSLELAENRASQGGAVANFGTLTAERVRFYHNGNGTAGGGLLNAGVATIIDSSFEVNYLGPAQLGASGGAIANNVGATLTVTGTTFYSNISAAVAAGIDNNGTATITNSTFSQNGFQTNFGGAIDNFGTLTVDSSTFADNRAAIAGGDIYSHGGTVTLRNSIFANTSSGGDCSGPVTDGGYNISEDGSCISADTSVMADPELLALGDNGGPTQTQAVKSGPAIDAIPPATNGCGDPISTDQRGAARPDGAGCDIGAYEFREETPPTTTITRSPASPDGLNGWWVSPIHLSVSSTDDGSGLAGTRCVLDPSPFPTAYADFPSGCDYLGDGLDVSTEGFGWLFAASIDNYGNEETPVGTSWAIDMTPPTMVCTVIVPQYWLGMTTTDTMAAVATDDVSGPDSYVPTAAIDTSTIGRKTAHLTGFDRAGNAGSVDCAYIVKYQVLGLELIQEQTYRPGARIKVTFKLADANAQPISDTVASGLAASCAVQVSFAGGDSSVNCAKYSARTDSFSYTLTLPRNVAPGFYNVTARVFNGADLVNDDPTTIQVFAKGK